MRSSMLAPPAQPSPQWPPPPPPRVPPSKRSWAVAASGSAALSKPSSSSSTSITLPATTPRAHVLMDPQDGSRLEHRRAPSGIDAAIPDPAGDDGTRLYGPFSAESSSDVLHLKRRIQHARRHSLPIPRPLPPTTELERRQNTSESTCWVGNAVLSCYPTADTHVVQGEWSKFIWNNNYPRFIQIGAVDIYLFRDDGDTVQTSWTSVDNHLGRISFSPQDEWWQDLPQAGEIQSGQNVSWPFYFVVTGAGLGTASGLSRQSTWTAVQTALPTSIALARQSSSSAASLSSVQSASSASAASAISAASLSSVAATASLWSVTHTLTQPGQMSSYLSSMQSAETASVVSSMSTSIETSLRSQGFTGTQTGLATITTTLPDGHTVTATATAMANGGALQGQSKLSSSHSLPRYAIALIVVFGTLALLLALAGAYFVWRRWQRRNAQGTAAAAAAAAAAAEKGRSTHSTSPMLVPGAIHDPDQSVSSLSSSRSPASGPWMQDVASPTHAQGNPSGTPTTTSHSLPVPVIRPLRTKTNQTFDTATTGASLAAAGGTSTNAPGATQEEQGLWSDEASRMADAFRNALRAPSFSALAESSPGSTTASPSAVTSPPLQATSAPTRATGATVGLGLGMSADQSHPSTSTEPSQSINSSFPGDTSVVRTILPLPLPSSSSPTSGSEAPTPDHAPTLSQLLQQELARDGMSLQGVSGSKAAPSVAETTTTSGPTTAPAPSNRASD